MPCPELGFEIGDCEAYEVAMTMLSCYAEETHDEGLLLCITALSANAENKIRVLPGNSCYFPLGQIAITRPDCVDNTVDPPLFLFKDDSDCNCILFNCDYVDVDCYYGSDDEQAGAAMLAALLMHELCHAKTLGGLTAPGNGFLCVLACNEVECYTVELELLCGMIDSNCVVLTGAGAEDVDDNKESIEGHIEEEEAKKKIMGCGSK